MRELYRGLMFAALFCFLCAGCDVADDPALSTENTGEIVAAPDPIPPAGSDGYTGCTLNVAYASPPSTSIGIVSITECYGVGYTGDLSIAFNDGRTASLGAVDPVCGRQAGVLLGLNFGEATSVTFTLAVFGPSTTSCSAVLMKR